jgi:periplasmic mercuric ion binding protein
MKYIYVIFSVLSLVSCLNKSNPEVKVIEIPSEKTVMVNAIESDLTFGVRGNCGMCKSTIESATMSVSGVDNASWSTESKMISINLNAEINDELISDIHNAIANSGYDTELSTALDENYDKLPMCCKYNRDMVITTNIIID